MKKLCWILGVLIILLLVISSIAVIIKSNFTAFTVGEKIALVRIEGVIHDSKPFLEEFKKYRKDSSIKAVVLRVNSPGGGVAPSQEIYEEIKKLSKVKPVIVSMGSVAASGGYYISSAATKIIANPGTITGSIGVIMEIPNFKGLMDKVGIKTEVIKSGKHKDLISVFRGIGEEERKILQKVLDDVHQQFIEAVSKGRNIPYNKVKEIADGRIFTGRQAKEIGLVDQLGNLQDAIAEAAKAAGIKGEPNIITRKEKLSIIDFLAGETILLTPISDEIVKRFFNILSVKYLMYY